MKPTSVRHGKAWLIVVALVLVFVLSILLARAAWTTNSGRRPNVIILLVDTLRADHLSYHGYERKTSSNLDRFAQSAVIFLANQSPASRTGPAMASLFTGLHVRSHGVVNPLDQVDGKGVLEESRSTLAEILTAAGYVCRGIVSNLNVGSAYGFGQGFEDYIEVPHSTDASMINVAALGWIDQARDQPFLLYLHYMEPHSRYQAPLAYRRKYVDPNYQGPINFKSQQLDRFLLGTLHATAADQHHLAALYDQEIYSWDIRFGNFHRALEERGLLENTIVVFVADHGEELFDHGSVFHGYTLYGEQLHVPLLIYAPGLAPRRVTTVTRSIDLVPTMLELTGVAIPDHIQGRSLVSLMRGESETDRPVFSEAGIRAKKTVRLRAFQANGWKYIEHFLPMGKPPELYDLTADPAEQNNVYAAQGKKAEELKGLMESFLEDIPEIDSRSVQLTREELQRLETLGYGGG